MVLVREIAARPANIGNLQGAKRRNDVIADTARIGNWGIRTHPDALVQPVAEVLGELAEKVPIDFCSRFGGIDGQMSGLRSRKSRGKKQHRKSGASGRE